MAGKTVDEIQEGAQRQALELIVTWLLTAHLRKFPNPGEVADDLIGMSEEVAGQMSYPHLDSAQSDLAAQELRDALVRRVLRARALATGEPFDPEQFQGSGPKDAV